MCPFSWHLHIPYDKCHVVAYNACALRTWSPARTFAACVSEFKCTCTYLSVYVVRMCAFINRNEQICCCLLPASSESMNDGGRNSQQGHLVVFVCLLHSWHCLGPRLGGCGASRGQQAATEAGGQERRNMGGREGVKGGRERRFILREGGKGKPWPHWVETILSSRRVSWGLEDARVGRIEGRWR